MIEQYLMDYLSNEIPDITWSISHSTLNDESATIYPEAGQAPSTYDDGMRYPNYQIFIRSSNFDKAKVIAQKTFDLLQGLNHLKIKVTVNDEDFQYYLYFVEATSDIIEIGVNEDDIMEMSLNFKTTLQKFSNDYQL